MSKANAIAQVVFLQKAGVYSPSLQCDEGNIYQEYEGDISSPTSVEPNFATLKPTLSFVIMSSRVAEGMVVPTNVKWYFNGTELTFGTDNVSTNTFNGETGHFKKIPYAAGTTYYHGLQIIKNIVIASGDASSIIKATGTVTAGNVSDTIQAMYSIPITKGIGNATRVTIVAGDNNYFTIREKGGNCKLTAIARLGAEEISANLTYSWYKLVNGVWTDQSLSTKTITISESSIDTSASYKVVVMQGTTKIGEDVQNVMDASDPYDMILNPNPASETIENSTDTVTYTPIIVKRGTTTKAIDSQFYFTFMDSVGNILNSSTNTTAAASGTCTYAMCVQAGGNVNVIISSVV